MIMKRKLSVLLTAMAVGAIAQAQTAGEASNAEQAVQNALTLSLPQATGGECQALVVVPAQFEARTEQVVIKEASETKEIIPAEYEWVEEEVMVKPAGKQLKVVPATYKTVQEEIEVEPASVEKEVIPPQYSEVEEEIVARPAYMAGTSEGSNRQIQSVSEVMRIGQVPAQYETISKRVVQEPAQVKETPVEAVYVTIEKQVVDQEAHVEEVPVEAEYETVRVKKLVKEAEEKIVEIPAEYAEVMVYDKVADAQARWEPVLCTTNVNEKTIADLQTALNREGYNVGTVDGAMGPSTLRAVEAYQRDNKLAVGGVTLETLRSLGINE